MNNEYKEKFIESNQLDKLKEDFSPYKKYIELSKNTYVTIFYNLSGDTLLIIPIPKKNKNFTTI